MIALATIPMSPDERCSGLRARDILHADKDGLIVQETWFAPSYSNEPITFLFAMRWEDWAESELSGHGAHA